MAPLIAPSGVGMGKSSVIVPSGAYRPKAQMVVPPDIGGVKAEAPVSDNFWRSLLSWQPATLLLTFVLLAACSVHHTVAYVSPPVPRFLYILRVYKNSVSSLASGKMPEAQVSLSEVLGTIP